MIRRILSIIPVLLVSSIVIFVAMRVVPGNPINILDEGLPMTQQERQAAAHQYHLDQSIPAQYVLWLSDAVQGNLGVSYRSSKPVTSILGPAIVRTLLLIFGGVFIAFCIAVPLAVYSAKREGSLGDQAVLSGTTFLLSVPLFVSGVLAIYIFAYRWSILPPFGVGHGLGGVLEHMILPWTALALAIVGVQVGTLRTALADALRQEYVVIAGARGLSQRRILWRHAFRSALVPMVTLLGLQLGVLIVGAVFIEYIFGLGGVGSVLVNAVSSRDLPVVQGAVLAVSAFFIMANLAVDIVASRLDPRYSIR
jgi:peptide/nickel transport system permease protein